MAASDRCCSCFIHEPDSNAPQKIRNGHAVVQREPFEDRLVIRRYLDRDCRSQFVHVGLVLEICHALLFVSADDRSNNEPSNHVVVVHAACSTGAGWSAVTSSGQIKCQSSGRRSRRVTAPSVARSILTQSSAPMRCLTLIALRRYPIDVPHRARICSRSGIRCGVQVLQEFVHGHMLPTGKVSINACRQIAMEEANPPARRYFCPEIYLQVLT